jgi:hypothetical protein
LIYIERTITINESSAYIEDPIVLYKGDRNIEVQFIIKNSPFKHKAGIDLTYGQLVIKRPATNPIFSEVAKVSSSKVLFVITGDMIDELAETGDYEFQIRLLNSDLSSRATLPPVSAGFIVKEPICEESVNTAPVNYSRAIIDREVEGTFDEEGNYNKTDWSNGDIITDSKLNKIEDALYTVNDSKATKEDIPTDVSAFTNDAGYLTEHQSLEDYALKADIPSTDGLATEQYVDDAVANVDVDLTDYATKDKVIGTIANVSMPSEIWHDFLFSSILPDGTYLLKNIDIPYGTQGEIFHIDEEIVRVKNGGFTTMFNTLELHFYKDSRICKFNIAVAGSINNLYIKLVSDSATITPPEYATKDELNTALGDIESLLKKI